MSSLRPRKWNYSVTLSAAEKMRLRGFIAQELGYFNGLVAGFAAPMRSMPDAILGMTGGTETLFGEIAALGVDVSHLKKDALPERLVNFANVIFDERGRLAFDAKTTLLLSIANHAGQIDPIVRRAMAIQVLRAARDQAAVMKQTMGGEQARYATKALSPMEERAKRHLQMPQDAVTVSDAASDKMMMVTIPYLSRPLEIPRPAAAWNQIVIRDTGEGDWAVELSYQSERYDITRVDPFTTLNGRGRMKSRGR